METEESSPSSYSSAPYNIDVHLELNLSLNDLSDETNKGSPPGSMKSPTIPIPKRAEGGKLVTGFNSIGCHVGSKTSSEDIPFSNSYVGNKTAESTSTATIEHSSETDDPTIDDACEDAVEIGVPLQTPVPIDCKVSEMSAESVIWLSHRLGPVLTARYLSRNLLRMLTLCYAGTENLRPLSNEDSATPEHNKWLTVPLVGDQNAAKVFECLTAIAGSS